MNHRLKSKLLSYSKAIILVSLFPFFVNAGNTNKGRIMSDLEDTLNKTLLAKVKVAVQKQHKSSINQFEVVKLNKKNWPNSALGCPKEGMQYMQMITPGYLVKVKADGVLHDVHTSHSDAIICGASKSAVLKNDSRKKSKIGESTLNRVKAIQISRAMLIKTKKIDPKTVRLKSVTSALITDFGENCKNNYSGKNKGYKVILSHENLLVTFFSDGNKVVKCKSHTVI